MAIIKNGILGGFSGKAGTVVGYTMNGKNCMRGLPERVAKYTEGEIKNTNKFKLVQDTLSMILPFIKNGFKNYYTPTGGMRGALSYNRKFAVAGEGPDFYIEPEKFMVTGGDLPGVEDAQFILESPKLLRVHWDAATPAGANAYDQAMLLAIDFKGQQAVYVNIGAFRSAGTEVVTLRDKLVGQSVHVYLGFVAKDRSRQSSSQYLGVLDQW
nr:DUF6266 family protein [Pedobacter sp. ASV19]